MLLTDTTRTSTVWFFTILIKMGGITDPRTFAIATRNLVTVLLINDEIILSITGTPKQRQHPRKYARGTWSKQQRLRKYSLEFCALARANAKFRCPKSGLCFVQKWSAAQCTKQRTLFGSAATFC